jgi:class 3 adenylate cyclase
MDGPLPEHPELRDIAVAMEEARVSGEILDAEWKSLFMSSELARIMGLTPSERVELYGKSLIARIYEHDEYFALSLENSRVWWRSNVPVMRHDLAPGDPSFDEVFGELAENAARVEPLERTPRAWRTLYQPRQDTAVRQTILGDMEFFELRVHDERGEFIGVVRLVRTALPEGLLTLLGRGDHGLFERMERVREPARRPAAILYADLEASSVLSRRLSSRGYFDLIGGLTDLIDSAVIARDGIVGKHAGDGGSALFLAADFDGSESATALAAIEAARAIRDGAADLGTEDVTPRVNIGLHWGATLIVGQVATRGRLDVTALGDQMNEGARIEAVAADGAILASKDLIERLEPGDAAATGIDPGAVAYVPLAELEGAGEKAIRDAGAIAVARL